jgi:hypothetical protein
MNGHDIPIVKWVGIPNWDTQWSTAGHPLAQLALQAGEHISMPQLCQQWDTVCGQEGCHFVPVSLGPSGQVRLWKHGPHQHEHPRAEVLQAPLLQGLKSGCVERGEVRLS